MQNTSLLIYRSSIAAGERECKFMSSLSPLPGMEAEHVYMSIFLGTPGTFLFR